MEVLIAPRSTVQVGRPVQVTYQGLPYIGLVKALANGKAFLVGINKSVQGFCLEPIFVPIDELESASESELFEVAQEYCESHCGSADGLCWTCQTLVRL